MYYHHLQLYLLNTCSTGDDPFAIPSPRDRVSHRVNLSFASQDDGSESSMDYPANISIGHTEVSLGGLDMEFGIRISEEDKPKAEDLTSPAPLPRPSTPESDSSNTSLSSADRDSPSSAEGDMPVAPTAPDPVSNFRATPSPGPQSLGRSGSLGSLASSGSLNGRTPRISKEEVQRRLMRQRSAESPARDGTPEKLQSIQEDDRTRISVMTDFDISTETAVVHTAEKRSVAMPSHTPAFSSDLAGSRSPTIELPRVGGEGLQFDFSQFGMSSTSSAPAPPGEVDVDMRSALDRLMDDVAGAEEQAVSMRVEAVTEGVQAGRFDVDDSMRTDNTELTDEEDEDDRPLAMQIGLGRPPIARAVTEPDVFSADSRAASGSSIPPPLPPKDAIKEREQLILEKRREARQREADESMGFYTPPREQDRVIAQARQSRRRSKSTGDMTELARKAGDVMADDELETRTGDDLGDTIQRELRKLDGKSSVSPLLSAGSFMMFIFHCRLITSRSRRLFTRRRIL